MSEHKPDAANSCITQLREFRGVERSIQFWDSNGGKPLELLELARAGQVELAVSDAILDETAGVLKTKFKVPDEDVQDSRVRCRGRL